MVLISFSAAGTITGAGAGFWDTMVTFLGQGQAGTGINFDDEGVAARPHLTTDNGDMQMWFSDIAREFNIIGNDSGAGGVLGPNLRLIGDTLTSVPALSLYQTNAVLADTHLGSVLADDANVNMYAFPATYSLAFLTYDTSLDGVGAKLWIGPGDTATIQWWSNAWFRIYSDEGVTETLAIDGQTGTCYFHGNLLDADVGANDIGSPANEWQNMMIKTDGRYFMADDQNEWMKSTGGDIRWGVGGADELILSDLLLAPVAAEGLSLGGVNNEYLGVFIGTGRYWMALDQAESMYSSGTQIKWAVGGVDQMWLDDLRLAPEGADVQSLGGVDNEWLNMYLGTGKYFMLADQSAWMFAIAGFIRWAVSGADELQLSGSALSPFGSEGLSLGAAANEWRNIYVGDAGEIYWGLDQDARIGWDNGNSLLEIESDNGAGGMVARVNIEAGAAVSRIQIAAGGALNVDGGTHAVPLQGDTRINGNKLEVFLAAAWEVVTSV